MSLSTCAVLLSEDACSSVRVTSICWSGCPRPNRSLALISAKSVSYTHLIDYLNKEISKYISRMLVKERNPKDSQYMSALFKVCGNLERIGDHAMNICEYTNIDVYKRQLYA